MNVVFAGSDESSGCSPSSTKQSGAVLDSQRLAPKGRNTGKCFAISPGAPISKKVNFIQKYDAGEKISEYMEKHKTSWALKVFEAKENYSYPKYIQDAIKWCDE